MIRLVRVSSSCVFAVAGFLCCRREEAASTPVYNISSNKAQRITWAEIIGVAKKIIWTYPYEMILWYPDGASRTNWLSHTLIVFFFQTLPAYVVDLLLALARQETL